MRKNRYSNGTFNITGFQASQRGVYTFHAKVDKTYSEPRTLIVEELKPPPTRITLLILSVTLVVVGAVMLARNIPNGWGA